jgi:hypothetical protein
MLRATSDMERETAMQGLEDEAPGCGMLSEAGFASRRTVFVHVPPVSRAARPINTTATAKLRL